jgi:hypothetical protein
VALFPTLFFVAKQLDLTIAARSVATSSVTCALMAADK